MKRRLTRFVAGLMGHLLVLLAAVVLVVYFLGVGQTGQAMMVDLANRELNGSASLGQLQFDPLGRAATLFDLAVVTSDGEPALEVGSLEVTASSLTQRAFSRLALRDVSLSLRQGSDGRWNLDGLMKEGPKKAPQPAEMLRIDELLLSAGKLSLVTPELSLEAGPASARGTIDQPAGGFPGGHVDGRVERFSVASVNGAGSALLSGLTGETNPFLFGPLEWRLHWGEGTLDIRSVELSVAELLFYLQGQVDLRQLTGTLSLMATREGKEEGALLARREGEDWALSLHWSRLSLPGHAGGSGSIPGVELSGLALSALPTQFSVKLNRLGIDRLTLGQTALEELSVSGSVQYESIRLLHDLLPALASGSATVADLVASWRKGDVAFSLLIERILRDGQSLIAPARLRVEIRRTKDDKLQADVTLALHPHGSVTFSLTADLRQREGRLPFVAQLHIDGLETAALLELLDLPGMVRGMALGRLEGSIEIAGHDLREPTVKVPYCRFELRRKEGGDMVFRTPNDDQVWDLSTAPSFSFFTKELKFGSGKMVMEVVPQG